LAIFDFFLLCFFFNLLLKMRENILYEKAAELAIKEGLAPRKEVDSLLASID